MLLVHLVQLINLYSNMVIVTCIIEFEFDLGFTLLRQDETIDFRLVYLLRILQLTLIVHQAKNGI